MYVFFALIFVALVVPQSTFAALTRTLQRGMRGEDVRELQILLKQFPDIYPEGPVTGYFGARTEAGVKKFQKKYGIAPLGIVGPRTRAKLNDSLVSQGLSSAPSSVKTEGITFVVQIPKNTPPDEHIYIFKAGQQEVKMQRVGPFTYQISLSKEELHTDAGSTVRYRYTRGRDFRTAEYLEPDTNDAFWTYSARRTTTFAPGKVQRDIIGRWRWYPSGEQELDRTTKITPTGTFEPRIGNREFRSGQVFVDLYVEPFRERFAPTAAHMKDQGYRWVTLAPPWDWITTDPLPKVGNSLELGMSRDNPNYPNDATLIEHIRSFKKVGLKVLLLPQICCTPIEHRNRSTGWWEVYFAEVERFLVHHGRIAEQLGVDAFTYAVNTSPLELSPLNNDERWRKIWQNVRSVFNGDIGQSVWNTIDPIRAGVIPDEKMITWADMLDFIYVHIDGALSLKDNPSDGELIEGAAKILDAAKIFYTKYQKPIMVQTAYFNVRYTWKGSQFYDIASVPEEGNSEADLGKSIYRFNADDLVRTINAYFEAIRTRPWVIGLAQFGYEPHEYPLSPRHSIHGKPAEDLWRKWNALIYGH